MLTASFCNSLGGQGQGRSEISVLVLRELGVERFRVDNLEAFQAVSGRRRNPIPNHIGLPCRNFGCLWV